MGNDKLFHFQFPFGVLLDLLDEIFFEGFVEILHLIIGDEVPLMDDGESVADGFNIGKDMSIEKHGRSFLFDINLSIGIGEVFGFLGPNGAGKTTTMKAILGLIRPD